jgi:hypothetical protein
MTILPACSQQASRVMVAELQIQKYHVFFEDHKQSAFGCSRDETGVFCVKLYRFRLSIYGRKFNRRWK